MRVVNLDLVDDGSVPDKVLYCRPDPDFQGYYAGGAAAPGPKSHWGRVLDDLQLVRSLLP